MAASRPRRHGPPWSTLDIGAYVLGRVWETGIEPLTPELLCLGARHSSIREPVNVEDIADGLGNGLRGRIGPGTRTSRHKRPVECRGRRNANSMAQYLDSGTPPTCPQSGIQKDRQANSDFLNKPFVKAWRQLSEDGLMSGDKQLK